MNMESFGRNLVEVLAERSLAMLRSTSADDVRRIVNGQMPSALAPSMGRPALGGFITVLGAFTVGAAIGAGVTALYSPTNGDELRKKLGRGALDARKQAMQLGGDVRGRLDEARASLVHGVEQVTTAVGLSAPAPKRARKSAKSMNGHATHSRSKKSAHGRAHHDA